MSSAVRTLSLAIAWMAAGGAAVAETCVHGKDGLPLVQVYAGADASTVLRETGLSESEVRQAVSSGLAKGHVGCISENAVQYPEKAEDWISVSIKGAKDSRPALRIEMAVRNGAAVTNQIIRWREQASVGAGKAEILGKIESFVKDLAAAYGTPDYRKGHGTE